MCAMHIDIGDIGVSKTETKNSILNTKHDEKYFDANKKRKESIREKKQLYNQQKNIIKNALSKIDLKKNNKITFNDDYYNNETSIAPTNHYSENNEQKLSLFDEDEEEEGNYFNINNKFEGKKGQKLLKLQSRFMNDKRFTLDERFHDDDDENNEDKIEKPTINEQTMQLDILESVLGHKIRKETKDNSKNYKSPFDMVRFDPSKPEHSKFEIKVEKLKKKEKKVKPVEFEQPPVEVSKEQFYKVTTNLKQSLQEKQEFSLLNMFGRADENDEINKESENVEMINGYKNINVGENPFRYDSSDTEDEKEFSKKTKSKNENPSKFKWAESFFYQKNDERLNEGYKFLKNVATNQNFQSFSERRRELQRIIYGKMKNVVRDNRLFQKKLGKRIKVKKAKRL